MQETFNNPDRKHRRSEAFFGRRKSKALSGKQEERFQNLFPKLRIDTTQTTTGNLCDLFANDPADIVMEIGFGGGEHLVHQAVTYSDTGFIGVEPFVNSMAKALRAVEEQRLENIRLYDEDAVELLDWMPERSLDRVDLLYPDPWPKMKHWKRRFVNQKNLDRIARVLKPGSTFRFASDIDSYVNWTLQHCSKHPNFRWAAACKQDWAQPYENWVRTRYEAKALNEGRQPCYLTFVCEKTIA